MLNNEMVLTADPIKRSMRYKNVCGKLALANYSLTKRRMPVIELFCQYEEITDVTIIYSSLRQEQRISYSLVYGCLRALVGQQILFKDDRSGKNVYRFDPELA